MGVHGRDALMNSAVFLDRDGVLNLALVRDGKPYSPSNLSELQLAPGAAEALRELKALGFKLLVVTNQPEVARGNITRAAVEEIHRKIATELPLDDIFVCYHKDDDDCQCRKPKPGMLLEGARKFEVDTKASFMVGDRWRDIEAGQQAGCRTIFIDGGYEDKHPAQPADVRVHSLRQAVDWILQEYRKGMTR